MKTLISKDSHWGIAWNESLLPISPGELMCITGFTD